MLLHEILCPAKKNLGFVQILVVGDTVAKRVNLCLDFDDVRFHIIQQPQGVSRQPDSFGNPSKQTTACSAGSCPCA